MDGAVVLYTCVFVLYGLMDVLGLMPQELRSAGVTLPALFVRYYGDQVKVASHNLSLVPRPHLRERGSGDNRLIPRASLTLITF